MAEGIPAEAVRAFTRAAYAAAPVIDEYLSPESIHAGLDAVARLIAVRVLRSAAAAARACTECHRVHVPHKVPWGSPLLVPQWSDPDDGHPYRPAAEAVAEWLEQRANGESAL